MPHHQHCIPLSLLFLKPLTLLPPSSLSPCSIVLVLSQDDLKDTLSPSASSLSQPQPPSSVQWRSHIGEYGVMRPHIPKKKKTKHNTSPYHNATPSTLHPTLYSSSNPSPSSHPLPSPHAPSSSSYPKMTSRTLSPHPHPPSPNPNLPPPSPLTPLPQTRSQNQDAKSDGDLDPCS